MMGISRRELNYWTRLRLVLPRARWGERFFNFSDLVALETIKRLAARSVPATTNSPGHHRARNRIGIHADSAFDAANFDQRKTSGGSSARGGSAAL